MKINAATIEEFFGASGVQASDLRAIDRLRVETAPELKRQLFAGPSITLLGYGEMTWANQSASGVWPFISLAPQKVTFLWQPFIKTASANVERQELHPFQKARHCLRGGAAQCHLRRDSVKQRSRTPLWPQLRPTRNRIVAGKQGWS